MPGRRKRIADVILQALPELHLRGTYWTKLHLLHACRAFDHNARTSARTGAKFSRDRQQPGLREFAGPTTRPEGGIS